MVRVPPPSARAKSQLPVLSGLISQLAHVAAHLPKAAAREMTLAVQFDHRRNVDPYGNPQAPVEGRRYDYQSHIAHSYEPYVEGTNAIIASEHKASRALQVKDPRHKRPGRRSHPDPGAGLGTWQKRINRMNRRLLVGARMHYQLGDAGIAEIKAAAAARKAERFEARNRARIARGLKPLKPRAVRSDRARVDALVVRAIS